MGLTGGVKSHRLSGQISPYCEKKTSLALRVLRAYVCLCRSRSHQSHASYVNTACVFGLPLVPFKPGLTLILQFTLACIYSPASYVNITCFFLLTFPLHTQA